MTQTRFEYLQLVSEQFIGWSYVYRLNLHGKDIPVEMVLREVDAFFREIDKLLIINERAWFYPSPNNGSEERVSYAVMSGLVRGEKSASGKKYLTVDNWDVSTEDKTLIELIRKEVLEYGKL